jgi:hypothetical protein
MAVDAACERGLRNEQSELARVGHIDRSLDERETRRTASALSSNEPAAVAFARVKVQVAVATRPQAASLIRRMT